MPPILLYTTRTCGYCMAAKSLLERKGAPYQEIDVAADSGRRAEMIQRAGGRRTVPQIFIDGQHIGGFDDLNALDHAGRLDSLLAG